MTALTASKEDLDTSSAMTAHTSACVCPIYGNLRDGSGGRLEGTGTLISLAGEVWLLTANHVLQKRDDTDYDCLAFAPENQDEGNRLSSTLYGWGGRAAVVDVGATTLGAGFASRTKRPAPAGSLSTTSQGVEDAKLFVHGFPAKRSAPLGAFVGSRSYPLLTGSRAARRVPWFDSRMHFSIDYAALDLVKANGAPEDWAHPEGLSGSAVWAVNGYADVEGWTADRSRIVGIVTDWNQDDQILVALRVEVVREFLLTTLRQRSAFAKWDRRSKPPGDDWADWFSALTEFPLLPSR